MQSNPSLLPIICNFHVTLLLVNVIFPSEIGNYLENLIASKPNDF